MIMAIQKPPNKKKINDFAARIIALIALIVAIIACFALLAIAFALDFAI